MPLDPMNVTIRPETPADIPAVRELLEEAFAGPAEADLVAALRREPGPALRLVAEAGGLVVGMIAFSPVSVPGIAEVPHQFMGLAPVAVRTGFRGRGIGSKLVCAGLDACRTSGVEAVVVLGRPGWYGRFGFVPASRFSLDCVWDAPPGAFQALELVSDALRRARGAVRYAPPFQSLRAD